MKQKTSNSNFRRAFVVFVVAGLLATVLLASFATSTSLVYGQTAGPTATPTPDPGLTATPTPSGQNGTPGPATTAATEPSGTTASSGGGGKPTNTPDAANAGPVVPGLPNTGGGLNTEIDQSWKFALLGLLLVVMGGSMVVMRRSGRSNK